MRKYVFDIPGVNTFYVHAGDELAARAKIGRFDSVELSLPLGSGGNAGFGDEELDARDALVCVAARGEPHLVYAMDDEDNEVPVNSDPSVNLDRDLDVANTVARLRDDIRATLAAWGRAIDEGGSNDDEHEVGHEMADLLRMILHA